MTMTSSGHPVFGGSFYMREFLYCVYINVCVVHEYIQVDRIISWLILIMSDSVRPI